MMITKISLPRRTFLHGLGATLALPLLDAMVPALSATAKTAANPAKRLGFVSLPNGQALVHFIPQTAGPDFEFSPILKPFEPFRNQVVVVSGLSNLEADSRETASGPHTRCNATWLNGVRPKKTEGADVQAGITLDQYAAKELGKETQLLSLELALESNYSVGNCENGFSCVYTNTISWRTPTMPLPMENSPRAVFERMFGDGGPASARLAQLRKDRSLLDAVTEELTALQRLLDPTDRATVSDYLEAVRDVERRIQKAEQRTDLSALAVTKPVSIPESHEEHTQLMYDLMVLAYQADITRVVTFQIGREQTVQTYPWIGVPEADHEMSHHGSDPVKTEKRTKINTWHAVQFARFLDKMRATPDGDGTLLDHALVVYGSGMGDGNTHSAHNLPLVLAGGGCGQLKGGRHLAYPLDTPMMNFGLSLLDKVGAELDKIGDSTGRLVDL